MHYNFTLNYVPCIVYYMYNKQTDVHLIDTLL